MKATHHNTQGGFSLIELMVSLSVFAMVVVTSVGALLTIIDANAKAQALYSAMTNLSFAVDSMSRNIRTGYDYRCFLNYNDSDLTEANLPSGRNDCSGGGEAIVFSRERDNERVGYRWNTSTSILEQRREADSEWIPITAASTTIDGFSVVVDSSAPGDDEQPTISFLINGFVNNGLDVDTRFTLQTRVTQRILNY